MLPLLSVLLAMTPIPQDADICATDGACRHVGTVHIEYPDGTGEDVTVDQDMPWIEQDNILLFVGESVTVTLENKDGALVPRLVRSGAASQSTKPGPGEVRFSFGGFDAGNVMLTAESSRGEALDYAALMVTPKGLLRTSVCTLSPGRPVFEGWKAPIIQLALWNFVPTDEPGCKTLKLGGGDEG